jgi:uncharacterized DUF497 family protein
MDIRFEWDPEKAASNLQKHGISFQVAIRAFADPFALMAQDRIETGEYRWQTIGIVEGWLLLVVAHTFRDDENGSEVIRIISARRADRQERRLYEQEAR